MRTAMTNQTATGRMSRVIAHLLLVLGAVAVGVLLLGAPAQAKAPDVAAWWSSTNVSSDAPTPPPPPDVKNGDLYVSGTNSDPSSLSPPSGPPPVPGLPPLPAGGLPSSSAGGGPTSSAPALPGVPGGSSARGNAAPAPKSAPKAAAPAPPAPRAPKAAPRAGTATPAKPNTAQAISGLQFTIPRGGLVGSLTLKIDGTPPPQSTVVACLATQNFSPESNGQWSDVPRYSCKTQATSALKNGALVFDQISSLVRGSSLNLVLVPGPLDRVVLKKPGAGSLQVSPGVGAAPPLTAPGGGGFVAGSHGSGGGFAAPAGGGAAPPAAGGGSFGTPGGSGSSGLPAAGGAGSAQGPAAPGGQAAGGNPAAPVPAAAEGPLTTPARRLIAAGIVAAEIAGFLLLQRGRRAPKLLAAMPTLGGRLRPPDTAQAEAMMPTKRGVGRFARIREGAVPKL